MRRKRKKAPQDMVGMMKTIFHYEVLKQVEDEKPKRSRNCLSD
jgi:hypothetical protein